MSEYRPPVKAAKEYPFVLDPFQNEAVKCLERNESVLVSAHTSAGKTVVAEYGNVSFASNDTMCLTSTMLSHLLYMHVRHKIL